MALKNAGSKTSSLGLENRLARLESKLDAFEELEAGIEEAIERRVHELRGVAYLTLLLTAVLTAIALGYLIKNLL
ncbi:MAG: hypothetical protein AABW54_03820 [Candidatus Micrarchaeota archaeon]